MLSALYHECRLACQEYFVTQSTFEVWHYCNSGLPQWRAINANVLVLTHLFDSHFLHINKKLSYWIAVCSCQNTEAVKINMLIDHFRHQILMILGMIGEKMIIEILWKVPNFGSGKSTKHFYDTKQFVRTYVPPAMTCYVNLRINCVCPNKKFRHFSFMKSRVKMMKNH